MDAAFEFFQKMGAPFWCFHDRDIAPEGKTLAESNRHLDRMVAHAKDLQGKTGIRLLWGTANLFSNPRYMCGAATNPDARTSFAYAAAQVKKAMEVTLELGGDGYTFWGGREGYETLLNTDLKREQEHLARFLHMAVDHAKRIGFAGQFYIEPKPKEPTKHQYDFRRRERDRLPEDASASIEAPEVQHRGEPRDARRPLLPARARRSRPPRACWAPIDANSPRPAPRVGHGPVPRPT